jgi:hypothetical protein
VAAAPAAVRVRVWQVMSRGSDPGTVRPLPEGVRVAYSLTARQVGTKLSGEEVPELRRVCEEFGGRVVLDLGDLQPADRQGVSAMQELRELGASLIGASPYVEHLLGGGL